jgi:hypothetical protein
VSRCQRCDSVGYFRGSMRILAVMAGAFFVLFPMPG